MADRTISVRLRVEDQFSQPVTSYTQKMQQAERATQQASQSATRAGTAFSGMGTAITGAVAAFGVMGVARLAEGLYQAGMEAQRAGALFESFGDQVGNTSNLLERLRTVSRGAVDDISLMSAASSMLSMGIAKNGDDVERLTNIAVTYAQAMGTDVASSIQNMNMLISNQSFLRLDQMGIGASEVRQLAEGYRKAGMDSSEAFTAAFLEVAEAKLPQMSQVADATVTEFQKLSAAMDNWWADFGERFAQGVNGLIGIAKYGGLAISTALFGETFGQAMARGRDDAALSAIAQQMAGQGGGLESWSSIRQIMSGALNLGVSPGQLTDSQLRDLFGGTAPGTSTINLATRGLMQYQLQQAGVPFGPYTGGAADWSHIGGQLPPGAGRWTPWNTQQSASMGMWRAGERADYSFLPIMQQYEATMRALDAERLGMQGAAGRRTLFSAEEAANAERIADQMEMIAARAAEISTDADLAGTMERAAAGAREFATFAQAGADALKNMSLSQLFGQGSGGRLGEIDQAVLTSLQAGGAPQETIDALARAMGLDSGQITQMSVQFEEEVLPMLEDMATQWGGKTYNDMRRRYDEAVANAAMTGAPTIDMASLMGGFAYYPGGGGPAGSYTVQAGDTASAIAARFGVGVGEFGLANPSLIMPGQQLTWGSAGGGGLINTDFDMLEQSMMQAETSVAAAVESASTINDDMVTAVDTLAAGIEGVFGKTYQLPVELVISGGGILGQLIAAAVQANGGTAPGTSNYNSRGGGSGSRNDGTYARGR